jgi:hypothetical protein
VPPTLGLVLLLAGCSASRIESGVFHSAKGYRVTLPRDGWRVAPRGEADLVLRRDDPPGGMLADATCGGREADRPLPILARHLTFGLVPRDTLERESLQVAGRPAERRVIRGRLDGTEVAVEAVVLKGERCVHDFLYVAPAADFQAGRRDFEAFVRSLAEEPR